MAPTDLDTTDLPANVVPLHAPNAPRSATPVPSANRSPTALVSARPAVPTTRAGWYCAALSRDLPVCGVEVVRIQERDLKLVRAASGAIEALADDGAPITVRERGGFILVWHDPLGRPAFPLFRWDTASWSPLDVHEDTIATTPEAVVSALVAATARRPDAVVQPVRAEGPHLSFVHRTSRTALGRGVTAQVDVWGPGLAVLTAELSVLPVHLRAFVLCTPEGGGTVRRRLITEIRTGDGVLARLARPLLRLWAVRAGRSLLRDLEASAAPFHPPFQAYLRQFQPRDAAASAG